MAKIQHLNKAPVIEAILGFQADASHAWDVDAVRSLLADRFPDFPEMQEQRMFENQILLAPGKDPEASTKVHPVEAFIIRKADQSAAVQVRRDGFAFSQLQLYPDWDTFVNSALAEWKTYSELFGIEAPFSVFIRSINRVSYPLDGFKLSKYFENPPLPPSETNWPFRFFRDHRIYLPGNGNFQVDSIFSTAGATDSGKSVDFLLDLTISPLQSLAESGDSLDRLFPEMRGLKNEAFFSMFTETGLEPYH
jgi:uncharacterized protein (TIGR04255 family)